MIHFFLFAWLAGQSAAPDALQHLQAGLDARKQHQVDAEITEFRKAAELDPSLADAFVNLGAAYMEKHDYGAAIAPLKRALELSPDLPAAHQFLGYALLSQGYAAEAIPHLERAGARDALGIAQLQTGQLLEAVGNFNEALAKRPNDPDLLYYLGRAGGLLSKSAIDTLIAAYPDSARAHEALGENYFVLRQMPQAEKEFQEALRLRPELPGLHLELGQVYANSAQWPKAEDEFRAEAKLQPGNAEAAYRLGSALLQEGKMHAAREQLERADVLKPNMPETLYSLGKAASLDGDAVLAEKSWNKLLEIERDTSLSAQAHFALATLYRKQGNTVKARQEMQEYQKLQTKVPQPQNPPN
jgi:tetratricopeptide (TPR) repeat protein